MKKGCGSEDILGAPNLLSSRNSKFAYSNAGSYSLILNDVVCSSNTSEGAQFFWKRRDGQETCTVTTGGAVLESLPAAGLCLFNF